MITPRVGQTATVLDDGDVLVAGGMTSQVPHLALVSTELFDPSTNRWSSTGNSITPRFDSTATLLRDGKVLVAGGYGLDGSRRFPLGTAELYDPATHSWSPAGTMSSPRAEQAATVLAGGLVLVTGGQGENGVLASAELYDPAAHRWSIPSGMGVARMTHSTTLLKNGQVLAAGGRNEGGSLASAELYDPRSNHWTPLPSMISDRASQAAVLLDTGSVLLLGGFSWDQGIFYPLQSVEGFDPASRMWSPLPPMTSGGSVQVLPITGGRVLAVVSYPFRALVYDYKNSVWMNAPNPPGNHLFSFSAVLLHSGKILLVGGDQTAIFSPTERSSGSRQPTAILAIAASNVWLLLAGVLLVVSGGLAFLLGGAPRGGLFPLLLRLSLVTLRLTGILLVTWVVLASTALAPPPTSQADVVGAGHTGELALLRDPVLNVVTVTAVRSLILLALAGAWATAIGLGAALGLASLRRAWFLPAGGIATCLWVMPTFLLAILVQEFQALVAGHTGLIIAAGFGDVNPVQIFWAAIVLGLRPAAYIYKQSRAVLDLESTLDYVRTAQAKGLPWHRIVNRHMARAAASALITNWTNSFRFMVGSLPLVEYFFGYPGLGRVLILALGLTYAGPSAVVNLDLAIGLVVTMALIVVLMEAVARLLEERLDPRLSLLTPEGL